MEVEGEYRLTRLDITILNYIGQSYQPIHFTEFRPVMRDIWSALYNGLMIKRDDVIAMRFLWKDNRNEEFVIVVNNEGLENFKDDEFPPFLEEQLTNWEMRAHEIQPNSRIGENI